MRSDEQPARVIDDLQRASERGRHDRQARALRLHERDAERFGTDVGLAVDVGRLQERGHVAPLSGKSHAIADALSPRHFLQLAEVPLVGGALWSADNPVRPAVHVAQGRQSLERFSISLPRLQPADLHDHEIVGRSVERAADVFPLRDAARDIRREPERVVDGLDGARPETTATDGRR